MSPINFATYKVDEPAAHYADDARDLYARSAALSQGAAGVWSEAGNLDMVMKGDSAVAAQSQFADSANLCAQDAATLHYIGSIVEQAGRNITALNAAVDAVQHAYERTNAKLAALGSQMDDETTSQTSDKITKQAREALAKIRSTFDAAQDNLAATLSALQADSKSELPATKAAKEFATGLLAGETATPDQFLSGTATTTVTRPVTIPEQVAGVPFTTQAVAPDFAPAIAQVVTQADAEIAALDTPKEPEKVTRASGADAPRDPVTKLSAALTSQVQGPTSVFNQVHAAVGLEPETPPMTPMPTIAMPKPYTPPPAPQTEPAVVAPVADPYQVAVECLAGYTGPAAHGAAVGVVRRLNGTYAYYLATSPGLSFVDADQELPEQLQTLDLLVPDWETQIALTGHYDVVAKLAALTHLEGDLIQIVTSNEEYATIPEVRIVSRDELRAAQCHLTLSPMTQRVPLTPRSDDLLTRAAHLGLPDGDLASGDMSRHVITHIWDGDEPDEENYIRHWCQYLLSTVWQSSDTTAAYHSALLEHLVKIAPAL